LAVARAEGIETGTLQEEMDRVCRVALATGKGTSSMLQDRLCGKKTEIDALNGMVVLLAEKHQINVPHNRQIIALVHEAEQEG
ncbi:MAG: 2-dehydropantoate 2-reductase, partial [Lentisphaeria bacterium]|nr:2-dehydropantoate 2-reductase [Lentisphaeria bacterium]